MKLWSCVIALSLFTAGCHSADVARGPNSQARHDAFVAMLPAYTKMVQMENGGKGFQKDAFQQLVNDFDAVAKQPFQHFAQDGNEQDGKAKAEVWSNKAEFEQKQQNFFAALDAVKQAAQDGNQDVARDAVKKLDQQCQACHSQFRK